MYKVELEEDGCTSQFGKHGIRMRHRPHMLLGLSLDRAEGHSETKFFRATLRNNEWGTGPFRRRVPVDVAHVQEVIALLLHEVQLLRRVGALLHLDWPFRSFELDLHGRNIDRRIGTKAYAKDVLVLQHNVPERLLQTVRQVLSGAPNGVVDSLRELLFIWTPISTSL